MTVRDRVWAVGVRLSGFPRQHGGILLVLAVALAARLIYLRWFKVFPPGDVFNFINIARGLPEGWYPPNERRLPFYPLLILLARPFFGWELASLAVAVGASLVALVVLYAVGRKMGLSKTALCALLLALQVHPRVLTATRGYADTTMFALLPLSLLALLRTRTWKGAVLTGAVCGAMALTRYEGTAAALALFPLWSLLPSARPRRLPLVAASAFVLFLVPYLVLSATNDRPAFGAGYIAETGGREGYGAGNTREFWESALAIWKRSGLVGAWEIPRAMTSEIVADPLATPRILTSRLVEPGEPLALLAMLGTLVLLYRRQWRALVLLAAATAAATVPPAWFNPLPRYDLVVLPLLFLLAAAGVSGIQTLLERGTRAGGTAGRAVRWLAGALLLLMTGGLWSVTYAQDTRNRQWKHNGRDYAYYQAIRAARALPGVIAFDRDPDIVRLYFAERHVVARPSSEDRERPERFLAQLQERKVQYLVLPSPDAQENLQAFLALTEVTLAEAFAWPRGDGDVSRAAVFRVGQQ